MTEIALHASDHHDDPTDVPPMQNSDQSLSGSGAPFGSAQAAAPSVTGKRAWRRLKDPGRTNLAIAAFCLALIAAIWFATVRQSQSEREVTIAGAVRQNANLAMAFEEQAIRTLKGVDVAARFVAHEYARQGKKIDLPGYIADELIDGRLFVNISVIDENGDMLASKLARPAPINVADREYFTVHRQQDSGKLFIGKPVVSRITGQWAIPMSRRINKPDGSFGGVVSAAVDPIYFTDFYGKADLGENGLVNLIGLDGISRARQSGSRVSSGLDLTGSPLFKQQAIRATGDLLGPGSIEKVPRYISYRTLADYPLVVAVGTSQQEVLAGYLRNRNYEYGQALLITLVIVLFAGALITALARQKRAAADLIGSQAQFRETFEQAAVGIAHTTLDRRYLQVNRKFCAMLGYTREELLAMRSTQISHPDEQDSSDDHKRALDGELDTYAGEKRYIRKDGSMFWANRTVSLARDSAGRPLYFIRVVEDISERKRAQEQLAYVAQYDALTGLPNRNLLRDRLVLAIARAKRGDERVALLFIDFDRFKLLADALGHAAADEILQVVAAVLRRSLRDVDTIARLERDEFMVILEDAGKVDDIAAVAEKISQAFAAPLQIHGTAVVVAASIGIAFYPHDAGDAEALLKAADIARYQAKAAGRNCCTFYSADMNVQASDRLKMQTLLRHALERREFELHYRPRVETKTGRIVGVEARIRCNAAGLRSLAPANVMALAEDAGLGVPIGEWVLSAACAQGMAWQARGHTSLLMSVKLSPQQMRQPNLPAMVAAALAESGLDPAHLILEIREGATVENIHQSAATLKALRDLGVKLLLGKFGAGQSSLAHLTKLPVQALKIDRTFIADMQRDADALSIVSTILTLARSLRLKVVAEGVENAEQEKILRLLRCDEIQGALIGQPLPAAAMTALLEQALLPGSAKSVDNCAGSSVAAVSKQMA